MRALLIAFSLVLGPWLFSFPLFDPPHEPALTPEGLALIVNYEVGGQAQYQRWPRPEWPRGASGVTQGIGYDNGYTARARIESDWRALSSLPARRLGATAGIIGPRAEILARQVRDIIVPWEIALDVFQRVDIARYRAQTRRIFPGLDQLKPTAQDALISLVYNRGPSLIGPNRAEMREIATLTPRRDYPGIAAALRRMVRVWRGTEIERGMRARREAEARLCER